MDSKTIKIQPKQGEVWLFDPDPIKGNEIGKKIRPCLVISNNIWNKIPTGLVIIVPLTSVKRDIPTHVLIPPPEGGLKIESFALCEQVRSMSKERLVKKCGFVSNDILKDVNSWILDLISLEI